MKNIVLVAFIALMTGCATQTYNLAGGAASEVPTKQVSQSFFVEGIGQHKNINAAQICGGVDKVIKVETKAEVTDVLLGIVTLGIYTPRTAKVYCKT